MSLAVYRIGRQILRQYATGKPHSSLKSETPAPPPVINVLGTLVGALGV